MKRLLLSMTALAALAVAAPAPAQYSGRTSMDATTSAEFRNRIAQLDARLQIGIRQGLIDAREARTIRADLRNLRQVERRYSYNGLSWQERRNLRTHLVRARDYIRLADHGRFDRDVRYGNWVDRGYSGQGGPLEFDACRDRGGIGGLIDDVVGRSCLSIGDRVPLNLYAVPGRYRDRYRDNADTYFRSDGRLIYEIDADTNRVVSSWDIE